MKNNKVKYLDYDLKASLKCRYENKKFKSYDPQWREKYVIYSVYFGNVYLVNSIKHWQTGEHDYYIISKNNLEAAKLFSLDDLTEVDTKDMMRQINEHSSYEMLSTICDLHFTTVKFIDLVDKYEDLHADFCF